MKFENTDVWGLEHALRGMRNPKDSWHLSDSKYDENAPYGYAIGPKDMKLAKALIHGGPEHRKFLRQIFVSVDITAPLYWWKEFDTYKVGTTANSCSTMHKIMSKPITLESFEIDDYNEDTYIERIDQSVLTTYDKQVDFISHWHVGEMADYIVEHCEDMRQYYIKLQEQMKMAEDAGEHKRLEYESYCVWKELIRWLPEGWIQKRTVTMTYENLHAMCSKSQRYFHKLNEWSGRRNSELENFIKWVREEIPYADDFILYHESEDEIKKYEEEVEYAKIFLLGCLPLMVAASATGESCTREYRTKVPKKLRDNAWLVAAQHIITTEQLIDSEAGENLIIIPQSGDELLIIYKKNEEA